MIVASAGFLARQMKAKMAFVGMHMHLQVNFSLLCQEDMVYSVQVQGLIAHSRTGR